MSSGNGHSELDLVSNNDDLIISINSDVKISGFQLSFLTDQNLSISLNDNSSDIFSSTKVLNGVQRFIAFSMENTPFDDNLEILIEGGFYLTPDDIEILLSSPSGTEIETNWNVPEVESFSISKMYPNPFNPSTEIEYSVNNDGNMRINVYNLLGQQVAELYNGHQHIGSHSILWNAENMASGVYYVNLVHDNGQVESIKAVLLK